MRGAHLRTLGTCLLTLATLVGCGGGGDGSSTNAFAGTYWMGTVRGFTSGTGVVAASSGTAAADGSGTLAFDALKSDDTAVAHDSGTGSYGIGFQNQLSMVLAGEPVIGGMAGDGSCVVGSTTESGSEPFLVLFLRQGNGFSAASLTGEYHRAAFGAADPVYTLGGQVVAFDGVGSFSHDGYRVNTDPGVQDIGAADPAGTYSVTADGRFTWNFNGVLANTLAGGVLPGGQAVVLAGPIDSGRPNFSLLLRAGSGQNDASFTGDFWAVGIMHGTGGTFASFHGSLTADGDGGYTLRGTRRDEGALPIEAVDSGTYEVASNGALSTIASGGNTGRGGLSSDGRFFAVAGGMEAGQERFLFLGVRK